MSTNKVQGKKTFRDRMPTIKQTLSAAGIATVVGGIAFGVKRARKPAEPLAPLSDNEYSGAPEGGERVPQHADA